MTLSTQDLGFAYSPSSEPIFQGLTHDFAQGAITAVTGPSGGGKSTLMYLLALMLRPTKGTVLLDGADVSDGTDALRSRIRAAAVGFVFQDAVLDPSRTVLDNVLEGALYAGLSRASTVEYARDLLDRFGVLHRAGHRPGEISGGQAQRVALCRALVKQPNVVLADEPTGNLDVESAHVVWRALADVAKQGGTVVVATHDRERASKADKRLVL